MSQRLMFMVAAGCGLAAAAPARAVDLYAQLFPLTGEVRLLNKSDAAVPFVFYSITSAEHALDGSSGVWKSIAENYDRPAGATPGNGLIDPNGDWVGSVFESSSRTQLWEGAVDADGGSLPPFRAISLGRIWDPFATPWPDLVFDIRDDGDEASIPHAVELALDGDYSSDQIVDQADYLVWRKYLNSLTAYFADGDLDGVVDLDDQLVWEQNFGVTLPLPPYGASAGRTAASTGGVPEPSSLALAMGLAFVFAWRRGRHCRRCTTAS